MKKINLIKRLWTDSHEKQSPQRFGRYAAMLIMLLTLGVGQMWAGTMYIRGERNDWGSETMTEEVSGSKWTFIAYWQNGTDYDAFKITSTTNWTGINLGGNGSNVNLSWGVKSGALYDNGGSKDIILPSLPTGGAVVKITVTKESSSYYVKAEKLSEEGNSWVDINAPKIYWDNTNAAYTNVSMLNGRVWAGYDQALGSVASALTHISNTNLWYNTSINNVDNAGKYTTTLFVNANWSSWETNVATKRAPYATSFTASNTTSLNSNTYLFSAASGNKGATLSRSQLSSGYSELNKTQTIEVYVKMAGGSYTKKTSSWPGTLTPDRYYLSDATTATHVNNVALTASSSVTTSAVLTSAFSLSESSTATGYNFDGWGTSSSSTPSGKNSPYSISSIAGTNTICAFFSEKTYTVTVNNDGNGTTDPSGAQSNVGQLTGIAIEAEEAEGYEFTNWTIVSGTGTFNGGGTTSTSASTTFYPTSAATIRANFSSTATSTLTVTATAGGSITTPAAGYYSDITTTGYSIAASRSEGYKFTGWTKTAGDGAVSFTDASALSTTATITTLGDVTVTAGFAAMSNALSVSSSTLYAGDNITLTATRTNHSLNLTYQYKIGSGSWTDIATQSGTSKTWQIPYANTYQTYKFRVKSTDGSTDIVSSEQTVTVKGRITIHVKNTNSWATMKLYSWYNDGSDHATNGTWNGTTGTGSNGQSCSVHATGSQWWDVTITQTTSTAQKFILSCSTSGDQNKTADLNLSSFTHDAYYAMSTNGSSAQTLSPATTPSKPTVSTLTPGTIRETSAVLGGNIANAAALGNDIITERGYYWSTNSALSSSNLGVGTKVTISGTQSAAGNFSGTKSGLTAGTTYYFLAYAKNGYGTGYSSVQNFTTLSTYTVTVTAGAGGSASPSSVTAGQYQLSGTITASANTGYTFYNWTKTSGDGTVTFTNANAASTTLKSTSTATVRANFVDMWNVKGSWDSWAAYEPMTATGVSNTYSATKTLAAKTEYHIKVVKRVDNNSSNDKWYGVNGGTTLSRATGSVTGLEENGGENEYITFTTDAAGDYTITYLYNANVGSMKVTVGYPTAYAITLKTKSFYNESATGTVDSNGGTVSAVDNYGATITDGGKVQTGGTVTFTATPKTGYTFAGWYNDADCAEGHKYVDNNTTINISGDDDEVLELSSITAAKTVYAKFTENMTTVTIDVNDESRGTITVGGAAHTWGNTTTAGVTTGRALSVTANTGYYFAGWTKTEGTDYKLGSDAASDYNEDSKSPTLKGKGAGETSGQTLTANFQPLEKIYFRNWDEDNSRALWSRVYVYFSTSEEGWSGSGMCAKTNSSADYKTEMTREGTSNIYWAYVPRGTTRNNDVNIAFSNTSFTPNFKFNSGEGVMRADYKSYYNTFVPQHSDTETKNGTKYYKGYWKNHNKNNGEDAGYYLKRFNGSSYEEAKGDHKFTIGDDNTIICNLRIDNTTSGYNKYMVTGAAGGVKYITSPAKDYVGPQITSSNFTDVPMQEWNDGSPYFEIIPTSEGNYVLSIDQSRDIMKISVNYPVSVNDYRLKNTYNDGTEKSTYSNVIKSSDASTPRTLSMYLNTVGSGTLVLQKCTLITAGVPQWTAGDATNLGGVLTTVGSNPGVYQFDVAVSADKVASAPTATKYTGPYYIKTDGATGGWANYKQNYMDENTLNYDTDHPELSFNYYYCKYYDADGQNLKCVIANDYCEALTDTLKGDAVIGVGKQTTPSAASVRFSYNSYSNEIKRSYLGSSVNSDFLRILGNTTDGKPHIYDKDETTFDDSHDDAYIKFEDKQNWRYEIDIKADVNARAKLTATFNNQTQYFMGAAGDFSDGNTEQLFGGEKGTYGLTLVYDFKTNKLIRAWRPTGGSTISENLTLQSDVLLLREHQGAPAAITFGKIGETDVYASLNGVKTVYSVLRFNRWKLNNRANPTDLSSEHCKTPALINTHHPALVEDYDGPLGKWYPQAERELYFISFPYDVKMSDIIHFGGYYDTWGIMYYDGKGRAKNGYWVDSESNWKYFTPEEFATKELKAYEGYLIGIDLAAMAYNNTSFWTNNSCEVNIYFPSKTAVSTITQKAVTVNIDTTGYQCTINRTFGGNDGDRRIKDSHWHCIGVPSYADLSHAINNGEPADASWSNKELLYLYKWNTSTNEHSIEKASSFSFQAMYAYLVQYAGKTLSWAAASATGPASIAAKRVKTEELRDRQFDLQLLQGDKEEDHTYIRLSDDAEVTTGFEFNHDVSKMMLNGANIYTLIGKEQAAANSLPLNMEQTTVVPVGVKIAADGEYTFAIPEGTEGIGVTLIDSETGIRTSLSALDYTLNLSAGTYDERFILEISPIKQTPTSVEEVSSDGLQVTGARKVMIDGVLYIVKDGKMFDAQGNRVK